MRTDCRGLLGLVFTVEILFVTTGFPPKLSGVESKYRYSGPVNFLYKPLLYVLHGEKPPRSR